MTATGFPDPASVQKSLALSLSQRWCAVVDAGLDDALARLTASHPNLTHIDTSPSAEETDRISDGGLGLHTDGYSEVPQHPSIVLLAYSRPVELRVLGVADVVCALHRLAGPGLARRLASIEVFVDADLTDERAHLIELHHDGAVVDAVVSPVARSVTADDDEAVRWWVGLWRELTPHASCVGARQGQTVVIQNRLAAHARIQQTVPGVRLRRAWLCPLAEGAR